MNSDLEQKLWNAGLGDEPYTQQIWYEIIDVLLDDFQKLIGQDFERDSTIYLDTTMINLPSFVRWIWSSETKKSPLSTVWSAVMGGDIMSNEDGEDVFHVSLTLFMFDANSKKRLHLKTGESVLNFFFEKQSDGHGYWRSFGWCDDEWGEWESVKYE